MHQARLRFTPSRWAIFPSVGSLTTAGRKKVDGSRRARRGRKLSNQAVNSPLVRTRRISSASIRAEERKSSPDGSHAWQSASPPNQAAALAAISSNKSSSPQVRA